VEARDNRVEFTVNHVEAEVNRVRCRDNYFQDGVDYWRSEDNRFEGKDNYLRAGLDYRRDEQNHLGAALFTQHLGADVYSSPEVCTTPSAKHVRVAPFTDSS